MPGIFALASCFQGSSTLQNVSVLLSFLLQNNIALWIYPVLFIPSPVDWHLGGFWFVAVVNNVALTI